MQSTLALSLAELEAYDPHAARGGTERVSRCPVCQSSERAFHFNMESGAFKCWRASCGATGKLSDFWTQRPKQNRRERVRTALNAAFALKPANHAPQPRTALSDATARKETAPDAATGTTKATATSEPATAATWQTHWNTARPLQSTLAAAQYLERRGLSAALATAAGIRALHLYPREYAAFPFHDRAGAPCAFQARAIDGQPNGHRAYGSKGGGTFTTIPDAIKAETVIICEAPIDALSLAACGYAAIALGGTAAPAWLPAELAFKRVLLAFDNDANGAGDNAAARLAPELQSFGAKPARLAPLREPDAAKSDWNGMLLQHGAAPLRAWLAARLAHIRAFEWHPQ